MQPSRQPSVDPIKALIKSWRPLALCNSVFYDWPLTSVLFPLPMNHSSARAMDAPDVSKPSLDEQLHNDEPHEQPPKEFTECATDPKHTTDIECECATDPKCTTDIDRAPDRYMLKFQAYARSLPYSVEPAETMLKILDWILLRITQCVEARDYHPGLHQWGIMLTYWRSLKYPIPKGKRIALIKLYFHIAVTPGLPAQVLSCCENTLTDLTRSKMKLSIEDIRLPWRPLYDILRQDLFLSRRRFEYNHLSSTMGNIAENVRRFFHPAAINDMLATFVPDINCNVLDSLLSSQYYLVTFLPMSHPQTYLPMLVRLWESVNSSMFDQRMFEFLSLLAEMHVDPTISDPAKIESIPDDERSEGEKRPQWAHDDTRDSSKWGGLYNDVGIFTEHAWNLIMSKCLSSMEIPLKDAGSLTTGPSADTASRFEIGRLPKVEWRIRSLARLIVYSMAPDGTPTLSSTCPTPAYTPTTSGTSTPQLPSAAVGEYLTAPFHKSGPPKGKTYLAGCKALDSVARLIASTEHFFHPTNSGSWTAGLTAFLGHLVYMFNARWHEERKADCSTPPHRRLTTEMRRELVKTVRTVVLLAMFSQDPTIVYNVHSCLRSLSTMEPQLIFQPILERAIPSLEALEETERTLSVISALGAITPAIYSRRIYYSGAKYLVTILQLLIPGIDLNDPTKTLFTAQFLSVVARHIMFHDVTSLDDQNGDDVDMSITVTSEEAENPDDIDNLSEFKQDVRLRDSTGNFPSWVDSFIRRVIHLLENLPEEGPDGTAGAVEVQVVDAVMSACRDICVHLSDSLFDLALNIIFNYASTNVRSNAVRSIHELVGCVAKANPEKTLAKFFSFCEAAIYVEIEHGASSVRTTSMSTPLPSDATLHWSLAILRGAIAHDGKMLLKYKERLLSLFELLRDKAFSKRGFCWSAKLLSDTLLVLTHTSPTEYRFVNPDVWDDPAFREKHYLHWGKLYSPEDVKITWHVPNAEEIEFALQIFQELIEPCMSKLTELLKSEVRNAVWRNDFCRYLCFVQEAFSGIPTLHKEHISPDVRQSMFSTSDIINEIPEMIASMEPLNSGFCLTNPDDPRYQYITNLRHQFGQFLHQASVKLRDQWEENTVDAVQMLISSIRVYFMQYGDSQGTHYRLLKSYPALLHATREFPGQKVYPRFVLVTRARLYHATRLRWNSNERARGPLEDNLIDDVVEWCMWHYLVVRQSSQNLLGFLSTAYDGQRSRALPLLYKALQPGTEDDRMKGALWTLSMPPIGARAILDPTLATDFIINLLGCHHNEKPSIQDCVADVTEKNIQILDEHCHLVYQVDNPALDKAVHKLKSLLTIDPSEDMLVSKTRNNRIERTRLENEAIQKTIDAVLKVANDPKTHWRYAMMAVRILRSLFRRDRPIGSDHLQLFLEKLCDSDPNIRYYAHRGVMKALRYIKLRTYCPDPASLALFKPQNPLKIKWPVKDCITDMDSIFKAYFMAKPVTPSGPPGPESLYFDRLPQGWLACHETITAYRPPESNVTTFVWEVESQEAVACVRKFALDANFWTKIVGYFAEENPRSTFIEDHVSSIKSIFQLVGSEPCEALQPKVGELLADSDKNKQRAAAELLAGMLNGSKHWCLEDQQRLWDWATPHIQKTVSYTMKTENAAVWSSFLKYMFEDKDPRRLLPLINHVMDQFHHMDFNGQSSVDCQKVLSQFFAFHFAMQWKFLPWVDSTLERFWPEVHSEHDDVRSSVADLMSYCGGVKWRPRHSPANVETFVRACQTMPIDHDIMGIRGTYHAGRVAELAENFKKWREERLPGVHAFQSTYDRVGNAVCHWLYLSLHQPEAMSTFDYILPLLPEIFRFTEINDNEDLANLARTLLIRMCGVTPPRQLLSPLMDAVFEAIQKSPLWKVRLTALPVLQVLYFRLLPLVSEGKLLQILDVLCKCLDDEVVEVREMVGRTLSGILRLSPRQSVAELKTRFVNLAKKSHLPDRTSPLYNLALRQRHAAIIGICALIDSFPYTIEKWMPELLTTVMLEHVHDPIPISSTIHRCASDFRKTHQDTWHEDSRRFNEEQLGALSTLLTGSSYYV